MRAVPPRDTSTLVPKLLAEAGALAAPAAGNAAQASGVLERFEARAQRLQLDVTALTSAAADPAQAAQHIAESADYLGSGHLRLCRRHLGHRTAQGHQS